VSQPEYLPAAGDTLLLKDHAILEMKFRMAMPALFRQMIEEFRLHAQPVSKYQLGVNAVHQTELPGTVRPGGSVNIPLARIVAVV
jgi:hypothetical protein